MSWRYGLRLAIGVSVLAACAPATEGVPPERLRISARDAAREAGTVAAAWADSTDLRYIEGDGVTPDGYVLPGAGAWRLVYDSPGREEQLVVTVTPRELTDTLRAPLSPPGFVLGDAALEPGWIDSPAALAAVRATGGLDGVASDTTLTALLVPVRPPQWILRVAGTGDTRRWRVDATTGQVIDS